MEKPEAVNFEAVCEEGATLHKIGSDDMWTQTALTAVARDYDQKEKTMLVMQAIRYYKKAIFWSLIISMCVIMEGFDTNLLGNFYPYPSFQRRYGDPVPITPQTPTGYSIPASWQSGLVQRSGVGSIFGTLING
ncbi:uncharacterized protein N7473_006611 [Penicillium subrubescens]|uniref:uncharacterized protein n=1 Tax=Penicillium subrubescens TaxID=1316194 RepID=UPI0025451349|nr:uncharacterized protein N7473_006611 [Penicillium subrubescens]KAJ5890383.1 hypothetical protein N7473_006611 [Penicillium subrubescens]